MQKQHPKNFHQPNINPKLKQPFHWCFTIALILLCVTYASAAKPTLYNLTVEHQVNPLQIQVSSPRLSWKINSTEQAVSQVAYEIRVSDQANVKSGNIWQSGKVDSDVSVLVAYSGKKLESKKRYYWQVRIWDNKGNLSEWSQAQYWEMGLLSSNDWQASWIKHPKIAESKASPMFRKAFQSAKKIKSARLYITSHGIYEAFINGQRIGDFYFAPGWTTYHKRLQYQTYDVTQHINSGKNQLSVMLGDGWYRGNLMSGHTFYGNELALLAQLEITYQDGKTEIVRSDNSWKTSLEGPVTNSDIYNGERYDARILDKNWHLSTFDDSNWITAALKENVGYDNLVVSPAPPVTIKEKIKPIKLITTPKGEKVIDFGQNLVGWINFTTQSKPGDSLVFYHAEVLDKDGNFYTTNLRSAQQKLTYIFKSDQQEQYHPHFSFQGFRYIRVEGNAKDKITLDNIVADVLYSDMKITGSFHTSDSLINQLQHNIQWGQKGNFLDVPTDCPQRDERLGWTGDAQAFFNTAAYNMDVAGFFTKWLYDVKEDQFDNGAIPHVIPYYWRGKEGGATGWADAATIIPWNFYQLYGDQRILSDQYESMKKWVQFMVDNSTNDLWNKGFHFGDWLFYAPLDDLDGRAAVTDKYLIAQAFFGNSVQIMINTAKVLGNKEDVTKYESLLKKVKDAFVKEYVTPSGRMVSNTQTAYVLALQFDMLPENLRDQAAKRLVENIRSYGNHLTTGFLGTPYLCHVLSRYGYQDVAYDLLFQKTYPSWLYPVLKGATTIWERWDGIRQDGSFQNASMNSFNHYAYGAIGEWMYKQIAGIQPKETSVGYKEFVIAPRPGGNLTFANASLDTPYGKIVSNWKITNNSMVIEVEVPVNTSAEVSFPNGAKNIKDESNTSISASILPIKSGKHKFTLDIK